MLVHVVVSCVCSYSSSPNHAWDANKLSALLNADLKLQPGCSVDG